jgi:hypothetical protein
MEFEIRFADQAARRGDPRSGGPPYQIRGADLDANFKKASPVSDTGNDTSYRVSESQDGWRLVGTKVFDVCENGIPLKYRFFAQREATN